MIDPYEAHVKSLIQAHLDCTVPLAIARLRAGGGPTEEDFARVRAYASYLGSNGDALLYHVKGKTGQAMDVLVDAVAVLAFCPGGIRLYGLSFNESGIPGSAPNHHRSQKERQ